MEEYLEFAKQIAIQAGKIMLRYFKEDNGANYKFDQTIVTKADTEINHHLVQQVKEKYPTHSVDGEEEQFGKSNYVWVCDPVDGTAMYARHIPVAVFSLALVIDGVPNVGVVYEHVCVLLMGILMWQYFQEPSTKIVILQQLKL